MKILLVSSYLPYPLFSGGHVRLYNLIKELSQNHKITLVCEKRDNQTIDDVREVEKFCDQVITVVRKKQWTIQNIFKTVISRLPFLLVGHASSEMKQVIVKLLNEKHFDVIHVETFYVFQNIPKTYLPIVLVEHNVEYLVYERYVHTAQFFLRPFLMIDVFKIQYWEKLYWQTATKLVAVSEREKEIMKRQDIIVVPNGVDLKNFKFQISNIKFKRKIKKILFIGDYKWIQNRKALENILKNIWPIIRSKLKDEGLKVQLWVVGKNIPESFMQFSDASIFFDENAPDETWKIYHQSDILLAPITVGGGTSYKILESMATGLPVITTKLGIEGIGAKENQEVLIGENSEEFAKHVLSLLQEKGLYEKLTKNARILIEERFTWKVIAKNLENVYADAVKQL